MARKSQDNKSTNAEGKSGWLDWLRSFFSSGHREPHRDKLDGFSKNYIIFRWISPATGYGLFFPERNEKERLVVGKKVRVGFNEGWKHFRMGQFNIKIVSSYKTDLIVTTREGLPCDIQADFSILIGGEETGMEERIQKATARCSPQHDINNKVDFEFFENLARNYCINSIKREVKKSEFINLLENTEDRSTVTNEIVSGLESQLKNELGLILEDGQVIISPREPEGVHATPDILEKWRIASRSRAKERSLKRREEQELKQEEKFHQIKLEKSLKDRKALIVIEDKQRERSREASIREIQKELDKWHEESQLWKIQRDSRIDLEKVRLLEEVNAQKRQNNIAELQTQTHYLELEQVKKKKEIEIKRLEEELSQLETELMATRGKVEAEITQVKRLAEAADTIQMRKMLLQQLPAILAEANKPIEKIKEIRAINISGLTENGERNESIGGLLASASSLPLMREVMRFLTDVEEPNENKNNLTE